MAVEPSWIAVIGTAGGAAIGAVGSALVEWAKATTQGKQERLAAADQRKHDASEARAQREAVAAEAKAEREHDAAQELRAERRVLVDGGRTALGEASANYKAAMREVEINRGSSVPSRRNVLIPDIVGMQWFESLRPYLADAEHTAAETLHCDTRVTVELSKEIEQIELDWFGDR